MQADIWKEDVILLFVVGMNMFARDILNAKKSRTKYSLVPVTKFQCQ